MLQSLLFPKAAKCLKLSATDNNSALSQTRLRLALRLMVRHQEQPLTAYLVLA